MKSQKLIVALLGALALGVQKQAFSYAVLNSLDEPIDVFVMDVPDKWASMKERMENAGIAFKAIDIIKTGIDKVAGDEINKDPKGQALMKAVGYVQKFGPSVINKTIIAERTMASYLNLQPGKKGQWNQNDIKGHENLSFAFVGRNSETFYGVYEISKRAGIAIYNDNGTVRVSACYLKKGTRDNWDICGLVDQEETTARDRNPYFELRVTPEICQNAGFLFNPKTERCQSQAALDSGCPQGTRNDVNSTGVRALRCINEQ